MDNGPVKTCDVGTQAGADNLFIAFPEENYDKSVVSSSDTPKHLFVFRRDFTHQLVEMLLDELEKDEQTNGSTPSNGHRTASRSK